MGSGQDRTTAGWTVSGTLDQLEYVRTQMHEKNAELNRLFAAGLVSGAGAFTNCPAGKYIVLTIER